MDGFYVSLVFFGVLLVLFSLICIFLDKKKVFSFIKSYDDKKQELVEIINDAEQMIDELNRFSDYIVNQMDLKNEELSKNLKFAEEKVNILRERVGAICNEPKEIAIGENEEEYSASVMEAPAILNTRVQDVLVDIPTAVAVNGGKIDTVGVAEAYCKSDHEFAVAPFKKREKVVPINIKYSEVSRLSQEGMQSLEIAKRLNMGKGEVELILGLRK